MHERATGISTFSNFIKVKQQKLPVRNAQCCCFIAIGNEMTNNCANMFLITLSHRHVYQRQVYLILILILI